MYKVIRTIRLQNKIGGLNEHTCAVDRVVMTGGIVVSGRQLGGAAGDSGSEAGGGCVGNGGGH